MKVTVYELTKNTLREWIDAALYAAKEKGELSFSVIPDYVIEEPREKEFGDFATNAAMLMAKEARCAPRKIAETIVANLKTEGTFISGVDVAGAGFINFKLDGSQLMKVLEMIDEQKDSYGRIDMGKGEKVMVEFVSANPTGPMHMGNARGGALGDCLAAVLDWAGYDVCREFYINDAGNQIEKFANSLEARYIQALKGEDAVEFPEDGYHGEDIRVHAKNFIEKYGDCYLDKSSEERRNALVDYALAINIDALKTDLEKYRIFYDVWFHESSLHENGKAREVVDELTERGYTYEKEGAIWFKATEFGEEKDEVLVRANGFLTYFAVDVAYHRNKLVDRNFKTAINIWGADHHGHVARLKSAMAALGLDSDRLEVILMQLVRLVQGGEVVRMSKRTGKSITLNDLLEETSIDAARFFFNMRQANSHFDFDLDLAVQQSNENPVFYVQYAHARICSILRLMAQDNITVKAAKDVDLTLLKEEQEIDLIKLLARFPEEIRSAAASREPSRMTRYVMDLAAGFHTFYGACRVKTEDAALMDARLVLVSATKTVIKNALTLLSIEAPEHM